MAVNETETWRPDAEPWEALAEADRRYDGTPEPRFSRAFWEGIAGRLAGMGWRLAPAYRGEGKTGAEIMADPPEWPVPEGDGLEDRVRELEAENERLRAERAAAPESYVKHVDAAETDLDDRHNP